MKQKEYEVIKPFTLLDIIKKRPCWDELESLVEEMSAYRLRMGGLWASMSRVMVYKTLKRNLTWLEAIGFIKEKRPAGFYISDGSWLCNSDMTPSEYNGIDKVNVDIVAEDANIPNPKADESFTGPCEAFKNFNTIIKVKETGEILYTFKEFVEPL